MRAETDPEEFDTDDISYLADDGAQCVAHHALPTEEQKKESATN